MPLSFGEVNQAYRIARISGKDEIRAHLQNMGFSEKTRIVIRQRIAGSLIVEVLGVRVALDPGLARRIHIQPE